MKRLSNSREEVPPLRQRQLFDVLRTYALFKKSGMFDQISSKGCETAIPRELAVQLSIDINGAKKVIKLSGLIHNEEACEVLKSNGALAVFADYHFIKRYSSISKSGGNLCIELLETFINGEDPQAHEVVLGERADRRKLDKIALQFTSEARDAFVVMFLKSVSVIATLCSFMPDDVGRQTVVSFGDIVQRYLSAGWDNEARQRTYHKGLVAAHLVDGWHIVSEMFKIAAQELWLSIKSAEPSDTADDDHSVELDTHRIGISDLRQRGHSICEGIVLEFAAWMFHLLCSNDRGITVEDFLSDMFEVLDLLAEKFGKELQCVSSPSLSQNRLKGLLRDIYSDAPTMADVKYDVAGMRPSKREKRISRKPRRTLWETRTIIRRGRWENTKVLKVYEGFLRMAPGPHFVPGPPEETVVPETPPGTPPPCSTNITQGLNKRQHEDQGGLEVVSKRLRSADSTQTGGSTMPIDGTVGNSVTVERREGAVPKTVTVLDPRKGGKVLRSWSDNAKKGSDKAGGVSRGTLELSHGLQLFYEVVLGWPVMPISSTVNRNLEYPVTRLEEYAASNLLRNDQKWLSLFMRSRGTSILPDASLSQTVQAYMEHWRHILHIEARGAISSAIEEMMPIAKDEFPRKNWTADIEKSRFIRARVNEVSPTKGLYHVVCESTNPDMKLRVARELQGGTICVGYIEHTNDKNHSPLVLMLCRSVDWDRDDVTPNGLEDEIDSIEMRLTISRDRLRDSNGVWKDNCVIYLCHLCHFAPYIRMFQSVMDVSRLPEQLTKVLCGIRTRREIARAGLQSLSAQGIDIGCEEYLRNVRDTTKFLDESQMEAMHSILRNIGRCARDSSSISMVQGPPGTGKTSLILLLIGALCHHSVVGHMGRESFHVLKEFIKPDNILRCSKNEGGIKFLLCGPSNQSVDNIVSRIDESGIPDGNGGTFRPLLVRLARDGYDYGNVSHLSLRDQALIYDRYLYHREELSRKSPSSAARRALSIESILASCTLSTSGGDRLKNMKAVYDILIVDEAGQSLEPENLIPIMKMEKNSGGREVFRGSIRRRHVVLVGDPEQLPAVHHGTNVIVKSGRRKSFNYEVHTQSLMERLMRHGLASCTMLTTQYRMHPCIAGLHSPLFYDGKVQSVLPPEAFVETYNRGWERGRGGFAPVTLIDTSKLPFREEMNNRKGAICNLLEVDIKDNILHELKSLAGDDFHKLRNEVSVLLPYRAQVDHARLVLERFGKYREGEKISRQGYQIKVDTVDSMQGSERDVVILGATRSNSKQEVGFVDCKNRLNVALSRARKLLVIVADMSTFETTEAFEKIRQYCITAQNGATMLLRLPDGSGSTGIGTSEALYDPRYVQR